MIGLAKVVIDLSSRNGTGRQQYRGLVRGRYRSRKVAGRLDRSTDRGRSRNDPSVQTAVSDGLSFNRERIYHSTHQSGTRGYAKKRI